MKRQSVKQKPRNRIAGKPASRLLARYRKKRDFAKTPEPQGVQAKKVGRHYLIQKHAATRLHYDFRLELDGVLKSWAVTRGPSLDPHDRRLAVEVEDHPLEYGSFEGIIPKGQYGGGTVMLWDEGEWEPIGNPHEGLAKGKLEFKLHGKRLSGEWTLVRMRDREKDKEKHNWLLIKRTDEAAHPGDQDALLAENPTSVVSGRTMEKIAAANNVWQSNKKSKSVEKPKPKSAKSARMVHSKMPGFIPPQLAQLSDSVPAGKDWVHEVKFDGYRMLAYLQGGNVRMLTRTGLDWTEKFRPVASFLAKLPVKEAIFDGEIVVPDEEGASSFRALQEALSEGRNGRLQYYVFDLLYLDGKNMMQQRLLERKRRLEAVLKKQSFAGHIIYSESFPSRPDFLQRICSMHLEGVVSKRIDSAYSSGRGGAWLKTKCHLRQEFVIGGFTMPTHAERGVGALLLGYYEDGELIYAGKVGTGFDNETSLMVRKKLDTLKQKNSSYKSVPADGRRGAHWVKPKLVCEVEFTEWTGDGRLRHPSFQGLREDKPAGEVRREKASAIRPAPSTPAAKALKNTTSKVVIGDIAISHPDRVIYPDMGITKSGLAEYYLSVADHLLPHVASRPLSMIRCPDGIRNTCFFQRHIARGQSPHIYDTGVRVKNRNETYVMIKDAEGLIVLVQWGVVELHPWGALADKPELPDRMIFDLDPAPELPREFVIEGAREVHARMQEFGLTAFLKTTGGKGLHVVVPLIRSYGWPTIKAFARAIAESMAHDNPKRYISRASKAERKGKIFVDYLRNDLTSTAVAPFSARAREGAPVAMPLFWKELTAALEPKKFTVETAAGRLHNDPWEEFFKIRQKISARWLKVLGIEAH